MEPEARATVISRLRRLTREYREHNRAQWSEYEAIFHDDDDRLDRNERLRILDILLPEQDRAAVVRFMLMLALSVTIAVMGLAANSAAVVIGAMLIAPLMTPIMTFSAAVGLGLSRRAAQAMFLVVAGTVMCIVLSAVLAAVLPEVTIGTEILARTRPDVRDFIVAIAAGTAGAYAIARKDLSTSLPGVAVAVALVPPLGVVGILMQAGERVLWEGALLLYVTNLLAIVVCALIVLLVTGVIPTIKLVLQSSRMALIALGLIAATVAIAIPLTSRSLSAADSSRERERVAAIIETWLGATSLEVDNFGIDDNRVTVELIGLANPPDVAELADSLTPVLGDEAEAIVRWDQRAQGTARAGTEQASDPTEVATEVVEVWLAERAASGTRLDLIGVSVSGGRVDIDVEGPAAPPAAPELPNEIAEAIGESVVVNIRWVQTFDPGLTSEPADVRLERIVRAWMGSRTSVRLVAVSIDGATLSVDLGAEGTPLGLDVLRRRALAAVDGAERVDIRLLPLIAAPSTSPDFEVPTLD